MNKKIYLVGGFDSKFVFKDEETANRYAECRRKSISSFTLFEDELKTWSGTEIYYKEKRTNSDAEMKFKSVKCNSIDDKEFGIFTAYGKFDIRFLIPCTSKQARKNKEEIFGFLDNVDISKMPCFLYHRQHRNTQDSEYSYDMIKALYEIASK